MALSNRNSRLAIMTESTEGTPVIPSGATDFIAVQDDISITPNFNVLENAELKGSIGMSKSIQGFEEPQFSFSHYLNHSGTEAALPEVDLLLKSLFGTSSVTSTEYDTVSSSTAGTSAARAVINVDSGEGASFERGEPLLIKSSANGYSIRPIYSIATDALSLGFNLSAAPASGVNLGKAQLYKPANTGHTPLSLWHYVANGGATQLLSGAQVTEAAININAGELINVSYSGIGALYYLDPIVIDAADIYIDWTDDDGTFAASITAKTYRSPHEVASALQTAMNDSASTETFTVTYSDSTGKFTIATVASSVFSILWNTGTNAANNIGDAIGFSVAANDTSALTYTSDNAQDWSSPYTPSLDGADPIAAKNIELTLGSFSDYSCIQDGVQSATITVAVEKIKPGDLCQESGRGASIPNKRTVTVDIVAVLKQHDAKDWSRFLNNTSHSFMFNFGTKTAGNWDAGKCGCFYLPDCVITSISLDQSDGIVVMNLSVQAHVDNSSNGEVYLGFV